MVSRMSEPVSSAENTSDRSGYWNDFYASAATAVRPLPSQFAAFVAGELGRPHHVIEFGSGSGRDAVFFASYGHRVTGVDSSEMAVKACQELAAGLGETAQFLVSAVDAHDLATRLELGSDPVLVYARFFVHAITDEEEQSFLDLAASITSPGDLLAVEYRTVRDLSGTKVTGRHYRRFVSPATFQARALDRGFDVTYAVEGFGFAKYRADDAYVARAILVKR
jgi:cyclopropane fatty-acyl-phospholipid synthase-like methyltransferase